MALDDTTISTLTEAIDNIIESSLTESVLKRLDSFGCTPTENEAFVIGFSVQKVEQTIKNDCNVTEVPEGLINIAVDMVCGEILSNKHRTGQLELSSLDFDTVLSSVNVGGASVSFDNDYSDESKLNTLVHLLQNSGRGEFACYRKIKW